MSCEMHVETPNIPYMRLLQYTGVVYCIPLSIVLRRLFYPIPARQIPPLCRHVRIVHAPARVLLLQVAVTCHKIWVGLIDKLQAFVRLCFKFLYFRYKVLNLQRVLIQVVCPEDDI